VPESSHFFKQLAVSLDHAQRPTEAGIGRCDIVQVLVEALIIRTVSGSRNDFIYPSFLKAGL
jgi:hypothetical protein